MSEDDRWSHKTTGCKKTIVKRSYFSQLTSAHPLTASSQFWLSDLLSHHSPQDGRKKRETWDGDEEVECVVKSLRGDFQRGWTRETEQWSWFFCSVSFQVRMTLIIIYPIIHIWWLFNMMYILKIFTLKISLTISKKLTDGCSFCPVRRSHSGCVCQLPLYRHMWRQVRRLGQSL